MDEINHCELTGFPYNTSYEKIAVAGKKRIGFRKVDFYKDEYGQGHDRWLLRVDIQATKV